METNSLFHTVKYKNHSVGYIFHSVGYKSRTVKQRIYQGISQNRLKTSKKYTGRFKAMLQNLQLDFYIIFLYYFICFIRMF